MHWIGTSGDGSLRHAGDRGKDLFSVNGTASMYDIGKIFKAGGSTAYTGTPSLDTALYHRHHLRAERNAGRRGGRADAVPAGLHEQCRPSNGDVVTAGGQIVAAQFTDNLPVMTPEIWSPKTGKVRRLAPMKVPRNYHSIGMLLLDGRVLFGGGWPVRRLRWCRPCRFRDPVPPIPVRCPGKPRASQHRPGAHSGRSRSNAPSEHRPHRGVLLPGSPQRGHPLDQQRPAPGAAHHRGLQRLILQLTIPADPGIVLPGRGCCSPWTRMACPAPPKSCEFSNGGRTRRHHHVDIPSSRPCSNRPGGKPDDRSLVVGPALAQAPQNRTSSPAKSEASKPALAPAG